MACVAVPDDHWGESVCAVVELHDSHQLLSHLEQPAAHAEHAGVLIAYSRTLLAPYKAPKLVLFRSIPRTATGKVQKVELRKALAAEGIKGPGKTKSDKRDENRPQ